MLEENTLKSPAGFQAIPLERHGGGYIQGTFVTGERYFYLEHELKNDASPCRKFFDSRCQNYFRGSAPVFRHFKAVRLRQALLGVVSFAEATLLRRFFPSFQGNEISPSATMTRIFCMSNLTVRRIKFSTSYYPFSAE